MSSSWAAICGPVQAETLDSLEVTRTEQGVALTVSLNAPHQFASIFPRRDSDFFLIRLHPVPLAGTERNRSERSRLAIPAEFRTLVEGLSYETSVSEGTYLVLSLYRKAQIQVQELNSLQDFRIEVSFSADSTTGCEPAPKADNGKP